MYQPLTDHHLDAILRAGLAAPKEGSRKTVCPECSRDRVKADKPRVSLFPTKPKSNGAAGIAASAERLCCAHESSINARGAAVIYTHFDQIPRLRYGLIVADPPWSFRNYSKKGEKKNPSSHYACMSKEDINRLPVAHIAAPDCLLWLWAVNPMLPQALETMQAWGFTFVSAGSWSKRTESGKMRFGPGYWLRSTNEPYLIGRIGNPKIQDRGIPSGFDAPAREHSRKPEMAYGHARRMAPHVQAIDLFSRQEREGFDCFGNEVGKFQEDAA